MKVDRYYDPYEDLEKKVIKDIEYAATRLGGTIQQISKRDYTGRSSKVIQIEYDVREQKPQSLLGFAHLTFL